MGCCSSQNLIVEPSNKPLIKQNKNEENCFPFQQRGTEQMDQVSFLQGQGNEPSQVPDQADECEQINAKKKELIKKIIQNDAENIRKGEIQSDPEQLKIIINKLNQKLNQVQQIIMEDDLKKLTKPNAEIFKINLYFNRQYRYNHNCQKQNKNLLIGVDCQIYCEGECTPHNLISSYIYQQGKIICSEQLEDQGNPLMLETHEDFFKFIRDSLSKINDEEQRQFEQQIQLCETFNSILLVQLTKFKIFYEIESDQESQNVLQHYRHECDRQSPILFGSNGKLYCEKRCKQVYFSQVYFNLQEKIISFQKLEENAVRITTQQQLDQLLKKCLNQQKSEQRKREFKSGIDKLNLEELFKLPLGQQ